MPTAAHSACTVRALVVTVAVVVCTALLVGLAPTAASADGATSLEAAELEVVRLHNQARTAAVHAVWMASAGHRANLMDPGVNRVGIGVWSDGQKLWWTARFMRGTTADAFSTIHEFRSTYGSVDDRQFVGLVYENVLDRAPDLAGLQYWVGELLGGVSPWPPHDRLLRLGRVPDPHRRRRAPGVLIPTLRAGRIQTDEHRRGPTPGTGGWGWPRGCAGVRRRRPQEPTSWTHSR